MIEGRIIETGTDELSCEVNERVAVITLNRPDARNALSDRLTPALRTLIARFDTDDSVGAVLLTGAGSAFCAGGDVKGMAGPSSAPRSDEDRVRDLQDKQRRLTGALLALRKPTLAALPGVAAGAGLSLALACDLRIAARSAFVTTAYARVGLSGDYGISWLLTRLIGTGRAREWMFFAERFDAARCLEVGLFNRVVDDGELAAEAFDWARRLANGPSSTLALMKSNLNDALVTDFPTMLDLEATRLVASTHGSEHHEAVRAFVEKRPPRFGVSR